MMNPAIDHYFAEGCGRCPLGGTPECKVHSWTPQLKRLRSILLDCGLTEELKWSVPCYTHHGKNILILSAFKEYCSISFFKGALLSDNEKMLERPGENTQSARLLRFTDSKTIDANEAAIKAYVFEAIEVEKAGLQFQFKQVDQFDVPEEFQKILDDMPDLKAAFEALTPGRQKGYLLHFAQPKQAKTRTARVEKFIPHIMQGKGMHDR